MKKINKKSIFYGGKYISQYVKLPRWGKIDIVKISGANGAHMLFSGGYHNWVYFVKEIYKSIFFDQFFLKLKRIDNGVLFVFSDDMLLREDHLKTAEAVVKTAHNAGILEIVQNKKNHLKKNTIPVILNQMKKVIVFIFYLSKLHGIPMDKFVFLHSMLWCDVLFSKLQKKISTSINLVVFYCDIAPIASIVCQFCKVKGIKTATLQHGPFMAYRGGTHFDCQGIGYSCSCSDYFLTFSDFTKKEALKSGLKDDKIKILGNPFFLCQTNKIEKNEKYNLFGITLGYTSVGFKSMNIKVIEIANRLSKKHNIPYVIRFHPGEIGILEEYTNEYYLKNENFSKMSIYQYVNSVDFTLNISGGLYPILLFYHHRVYRYTTNDILDVYRNIKWNAFSNYNELEWLINNNIDLTDIQRNYLMGTVDCKENYQKFFEEYLN